MTDYGVVPSEYDAVISDHLPSPGIRPVDKSSRQPKLCSREIGDRQPRPESERMCDGCGSTSLIMVTFGCSCGTWTSQRRGGKGKHSGLIGDIHAPDDMPHLLISAGVVCS
jgi:hypothetical protein